MSRILNRIYNDYFMKDRILEYEKLLLLFKKNGYTFLCHKDYKKINDFSKTIFIRHDIDSDVKIARKMFEVEKKLEIKSTYYFRLNTIDDRLVKDIINYGSEFGYHYEEIANYAKKYHIKDEKIIKNHYSKIRDEFLVNLKKLEERFKYKILTIAAHGDFVNRKLKVSNLDFINKDIRDKSGIVLEAYDNKLNKYIDFRIKDGCYPNFWDKGNPKEAIEKEYRNVLILIHTRWWNKSPLIRIKDDIKRVIEEVKYEIQ